MKTNIGVLTTPDGRYIVVRGRLWRRSNPELREDERKRLVGADVGAQASERSRRRPETSSRG